MALEWKSSRSKAMPKSSSGCADLVFVYQNLPLVRKLKALDYKQDFLAWAEDASEAEDDAE